jgi:hypothetical protein
MQYIDSSSATLQLRNMLKPLKRYLPFVAIQNLEDGEEQPPALDDFDDP